MIYTVTLNPAIDYTVSAERFQLGEINRCGNGSLEPGGKGVNVSLLLRSLGLETIALGFAAGFTGKELVRLLENAGCGTDFAFLPQGHTRINVKICGPGQQETALNGPGPELSPKALDRLGDKLDRIKSGDSLVLAGSLPPSLPLDSYARLLRRVAGKAVFTVVDAAGEALLAALSCRPSLIKPNLQELEEACGMPVRSVPGAVECARSLQRMGARNVAVSLGAKGAFLLLENGQALFCPSPSGRARSTVGAGDSLVAGFLYGRQICDTPESALRWGIAAGAATAFSSKIASGGEVKKIFPSVREPYPLESENDADLPDFS